MSSQPKKQICGNCGGADSVHWGVSLCNCIQPNFQQTDTSSWIGIEKDLFFSVDRTKKPYRFSDEYVPEKKTLLERLKLAWRAFNENY